MKEQQKLLVAMFLLLAEDCFKWQRLMSDTTNKYKDLGVKINNTKAIKII